MGKKEHRLSSPVFLIMDELGVLPHVLAKGIHARILGGPQTKRCLCDTKY